MQDIEDIRNLNAERLDFLAIDIEIKLRGIGRIGGEHLAQRRVLIGGKHQAACRLGNIAGAAAGQAEQLVLEPASRSQSDDRRQVIDDNVGILDRLQFSAQLAKQSVDGQFHRRAVRKGLQRDHQQT